MSSFVSLNTSRNHQRTLWVPDTNYFDAPFVPLGNSAPQGLHPECHAEGAKRGKSSTNNWSKTTSGLFWKPLIPKERPFKGREARANIVVDVVLVFSLSNREIRCSTPPDGPTSGTGTTKHQTHPAPLSAVADRARLYLRRTRTISRCAEISPREHIAPQT